MVTKVVTFAFFVTSKISMASDKKHLRLRGNVWWLHYRIPERHKLLPECLKYKEILTKNLKTDSLLEARRRRDIFLRGLEAQAEDHYRAWLPYGGERREEFAEKPKVYKSPFAIRPPEVDPRVLALRKVLERGQAILGSGDEKKKLESVAIREREVAHALFGYPAVADSNMKQLTKLVVRDSRNKGLSEKTISKINRASEWFLDHLVDDDIDISKIDYDQVSQFIHLDLEAGVGGSTLNGYLYGLRQIWKRAKLSKLVTGDCPFSGHHVKTDSKSYDPFTYDEIIKLYRAAKGELKILIHAAATTGARADELLTADIKTPSNFSHPCWFFKFKEKGKTEQSTRVVPLHESLKLSDGFRFTVKYKTIQNQMKRLVESVMGKPVNEFTGQPRKLSMHSLRASVITELVVKHKINEKVVGSITGHLGGDTSKVGSIRTYIHPDDLNEKKAIVDFLPWTDSDG